MSKLETLISEAESLFEKNKKLNDLVKQLESVSPGEMTVNKTQLSKLEKLLNDQVQLNNSSRNTCHTLLQKCESESADNGTRQCNK